jgi:hypothetical protein
MLDMSASNVSILLYEHIKDLISCHSYLSGGQQTTDIYEIEKADGEIDCLLARIVDDLTGVGVRNTLNFLSKNRKKKA